MEKLFKDYELVDYLGGTISLSKVRHFRLVGGFIPFVRIGAAVRYRQIDVDAYLSSLQQFQSTREKLEFDCVRKEQELSKSIRETAEPFAAVVDKLDLCSMAKEATEPPVYKGGKNDKR